MRFVFKPTLRCNILCPHCHIGSKRDKYADMDIDDARVMLSKIRDAEEICFHGGEPTVMGVDYFGAIAAPGYRYSMQSNLLYVDRRWMPFVVDVLEGRISTSFDVHRSIRPIDGRLWKENISLLAKNGVRPIVMSMFWRGNQDNADDIFSFFDSMSLSFRLSPVAKEGYARENYSALRHDEMRYADAVKRIFDLWFMNPKTEIVVEPCGEILSYFILGRSYRKQLSNWLNVNPDGEVYPSGAWEDMGRSFGNLLTHSFQEIVFSPRQLELKKQYLAFLDSCHHCAYVALCLNDCNLYADGREKHSLCNEYKEIFGHIAKRADKENGDVIDWWAALRNNLSG